jgi:hypothetical protein
LIHDLPFVREQLRLSVDEQVYVDCHVWLFTPQLFVDQIAELARMDLVDFVVDCVVPTATNELEFYAVLRRLPRGLDRAQGEYRRPELTGLDGEPPVHTDRGGAISMTPREQQLIEAKRRIVGGLRRAGSRARSAMDRPR